MSAANARNEWNFNCGMKHAAANSRTNERKCSEVIECSAGYSASLNNSFFIVSFAHCFIPFISIQFVSALAKLIEWMNWMK